MPASLADLFGSLPVETQQDILQHLDSRPHLLALTHCSQHLRELCARYLHADIRFDPFCSEQRIAAYLEHTARPYAHHCRKLHLDFSLGPCINRDLDKERACKFAEIIGKTSERLEVLEINTAGSDLRDISDTLTAVAKHHPPNLRSLTLHLYDVEEHEARTLADCFLQIAESGSELAALSHLDIEGYWRLASGPEVVEAGVYHGFRSMIHTLPSLRKLRLSSLAIPPQDLADLLKGLAITSLNLCDLQDVGITAISKSLQGCDLDKKLEELTLSVACESLLTPDFSASGAIMPRLKTLALRTDYCASLDVAGSAVLELYHKFFLHDGRTSQSSFPELQTIRVFDGLHNMLLSSRFIAGLIVDAKHKGLLPSLKAIECSSCTRGEISATIIQDFERAGVAVLFPPGSCKVKPRMIYVNRLTIADTHNEQYQTSANQAFFELALGFFEATGQVPTLIL